MFKRLWQEVRRTFQKKAAILQYHHVCERKTDPWQMAVTPERFQSHMDALSRDFRVVPMEELVTCIKTNKLESNMVAITFDDGFANNYTNAAPILEWFGMPASFYLTSGAIRNPKLYWWDELQAIILFTEKLPKDLSLKIVDQEYTFSFKRDCFLNAKSSHDISRWQMGSPVKNERVDLFLKLWQLLKPLQHLDQYTIMRKLRTWAEVNYIPLGSNAPMQGYQVKKMAASPLFEVGGHTVNHAMLGTQTEIVQSYEIKECKLDIEEISEKKVDGFAYPFGNYNDVSRSLLETSGFKYGVTSQEGAVTVDSDPFRLPRLKVENWDGKEFSWKVKQMLK